MVGGGDCHPVRDCGVVCSKDVISVFVHVAREIAIVAITAGKRRGNGVAGRRKIDTGRHRRASRNGTSKANATESESRAGNDLNQKQLTRLRG